MTGKKGKDYSFEDHAIESFQRSPLRKLFPLIRQGIYHRTSIEGYLGIRERGSILPNDGRFSFSYPQSKNSYASTQRYVSLFDLESATEEQCIRIHYTWSKFFFDQEPVTILLKLDRRQLADKLIPNSAAPTIKTKAYKIYIPYVEAWYPEPIPLGAVESRLITFLARGEGGGLKFVKFGNDRITEFNDTLAWIEEETLRAAHKRERAQG